MQQKYDEIMQELNSRMTAFDLNGKQIITDCKAMIGFLKEKLAEVKSFLQTHPFNDEENEIIFFKYQKPTLLGRLFYFYKILRIESLRPLGNELLDEYYEEQQEELRIFFDHHVAFFQYYRSGATHMDKYYFLRGQQENVIDIDVCYFDDDSDFSTVYDHMVARIIAMEMLYAFLSVRRNSLQQSDVQQTIDLLKTKGVYKWTGTAIELMEIVYGLDEIKSINNGETPIHELAAFVGGLLDMDIRDCYSAYTDMKKRKNESRTYFLDKMRNKLNKRMEKDDEMEKKRK